MTPRIPAELPDGLKGGPFTTGDARRAGVHPERLRDRDLDATVFGVRDRAGASDSVLGRCRLFAERLGPEVFFSHSTAAVLFGVPLPARLERERNLHVTVRAPARAPHATGIRGHSRAVLEGDVVEFAGVLTSSPARLVCELSRQLDLADLVAAIDFLVGTTAPWCSLTHVAERVACGDDLTRSRRLRRALGLADERAESRPESVLRVALTLAGMPPTHVNLEVTASGGRRFRIDLAYADAKVAIEYQGGYHFDPAQRRRDMTRRSWLEADGWTVIEFNSDDLADIPGLVARVRAALARR